MKFLNNLNIGKRLAFGFAVTLALSIVIAAIGVWRLQQVAGATRHMMETPLAKERMISDWYSKIDSAIRRTTAIARSSDASLGAFFAEESKASTAASSELQKRIEPLISDPDEKELFDRIMAQRKVYIASRDLPPGRRAIPGAGAGPACHAAREDRRHRQGNRQRIRQQPQFADGAGRAGRGVRRTMRVRADQGHHHAVVACS
jgi:hypothetical protein